MLDIVRTNGHVSFLLRFPQWRGLYERVQQEWGSFVDSINAEFAAIPWPTTTSPAGSDSPTEASSMEECVPQVKKTGILAPVLFKMWHRRAPAREVLRDYPQNLLLRMVRDWKRRTGAE